MASKPPPRVNTKPMKKPPAVPQKLTIEKIKITTPKATCRGGFNQRQKALITMTAAQTKPRNPAFAPKPPRYMVKALLKILTCIPANAMKIAPITDKTRAVEGYSDFGIIMT